MVKVLVPLAEGFEDLEAFTVINILRRAGIQVETAGLIGNIVISKAGIRMFTDSRIIDIEKLTYDGIILPGGSPGYENLMSSERLCHIVRLMAENGKVVGAMSEAPLILNKIGVLKDKKATIASGKEKDLDRPRAEKVVVDGNIITTQGLGTSIDFAFKVIEHFLGKQTAASVRKRILA